MFPPIEGYLHMGFPVSETLLPQISSKLLFTSYLLSIISSQPKISPEPRPGITSLTYALTGSGSFPPQRLTHLCLYTCLCASFIRSVSLPLDHDSRSALLTIDYNLPVCVCLICFPQKEGAGRDPVLFIATSLTSSLGPSTQ